MANLATAYGKVNVKSKKITDYKKFWNALECATFSDYGIYLLRNSGKDNENEYEFSACSPWSFANMLNQLCRCLKKKLDDSKELLNVMEENDFELTFSYVDEECGFELLEKGELKLIHKEKTPLEETEIKEINIKEYAHVWYNLKLLGLGNTYDEIIQGIVEFEKGSKTKLSDPEIDIPIIEDNLSESIEEMRKNKKDVTRDQIYEEFKYFDQIEDFDLQTFIETILPTEK